MDKKIDLLLRAQIEARFQQLHHHVKTVLIPDALKQFKVEMEVAIDEKLEELFAKIPGNQELRKLQKNTTDYLKSEIKSENVKREKLRGHIYDAIGELQDFKNEIAEEREHKKLKHDLNN